MNKDIIYQCDYGTREPIKVKLSEYLEKYSADELQMVAVFANNNVYNLELYIILSFDNERTRLINTIKTEMQLLGLSYRPDISLEELINETLKNRRFNTCTFISSKDILEKFDSLFNFIEKKDALKISDNIPLGKQRLTFLSHTSADKHQIENLIPFLNAAGLNVFFDKTSIDYGESITQKIQTGIRESGAVIFWISKLFLESNWCKQEMDSFLTLHSSKNNILIISIVQSDIEEDSLPIFIQKLKYLKADENTSIETISKELTPSLKRFFN